MVQVIVNTKCGPQASGLMTKHSKNNTASSIFSYAEYKKLDYGTKKVSYGTLVKINL